MNPAPPVRLARRLGVFDAALIVMGGIIGSGIFRNPSVVAQRVHTPALILAVWACGGIVALLGAFIFAELAARRPSDGGLYAYMRDAFHPVVAFMYGWTLLLVSQSGGAAASAITFAGYLQRLDVGRHASQPLVAVITLGFLTVVNCFGVRAGSNVQNLLMVLKIGAIVALIAVGFSAHGPAITPAGGAAFAGNWDMLTAVGVAMIPVLFAYSGWQTLSFMTGELKDPRRTLPAGMLWGVVSVVVLYMLVNYVSVHALTPAGLMRTDTPASDVMQAGAGTARRADHRSGRNAVDFRLHEQSNFDFAARLPRDGIGRPVFQESWMGASPDACPDRGDRAAGRVCDRHCVVRPVRPDS